MKVVDAIKELQELVDENGNDLNVDFRIVAPESVCEDDSMDISVDFKGAIGTSLLSEGWVEIGFRVVKGYEKHFWEKLTGKQIEEERENA